MKKIGYARVSKKKQILDLQINALEKYGCKKIYLDKMSGSRDRKNLENAIRSLKAGDQLVAWRTDRFGRDFEKLYRNYKKICRRGAVLIGIDDGVDTSTPAGEELFLKKALDAELEKRWNSRRVKAGLQAAKARGAKLGRPRGFSKRSKQVMNDCIRLYNQDYKVRDICKELNISLYSVYKFLKYRRQSLRKESKK